ncbi:hypothetical protein Xvie_02150 [Xenorhabdus vietnamensis]|uniref:Uncharacterized protein n=1 Tax=Xenorhabdus vietnamensis TaxID=351656 RepID=A0A1Y2SCW1_9GAMM|nr:hypothetical protein Xvie_02150 [Xenorhabdus vietnamensis]
MIPNSYWLFIELFMLVTFLIITKKTVFQQILSVFIQFNEGNFKKK